MSVTFFWWGLAAKSASANDHGVIYPFMATRHSLCSSFYPLFFHLTPSTFLTCTFVTNLGLSPFSLTSEGFLALLGQTLIHSVSSHPLTLIVLNYFLPNFELVCRS